MIATALPLYILWHYTEGTRAAFVLGKNFIKFIFNFFSIPLLVKTFFSPFRRLSETYAKGLNPEQWLETFVVNTLMRMVGAMMRLIIIVAGFLATIGTALFSLIFIILWLLLPVVVVTLIIGGLFLLI